LIDSKDMVVTWIDFATIGESEKFIKSITSAMEKLENLENQRIWVERRASVIMTNVLKLMIMKRRTASLCLLIIVGTTKVINIFL